MGGAQEEKSDFKSAEQKELMVKRLHDCSIKERNREPAYTAGTSVCLPVEWRCRL